MFVHDFVAVPLPIAVAVAALSSTLGSNSRDFVVEAWKFDRSVWTAAGLRREDLTPGNRFSMVIGRARVRPEGVVIPFSWTGSGARLIPALDSDLELAARGPAASDLQLLGRYQYESAPPRSVSEASLSHRATVVAVRQFLVLISTAMADLAGASTARFEV